MDTSRRQSSFERRMVCAVCLSPRLEMVAGTCQHRLCTACVYTNNGDRRAGLSKCPTCQLEDAFPQKRPIIPEDSIELQRCLGITSCTNEGCRENMWAWELDDHLEKCCSRTTPQKDSKENAIPATEPRPSRANRIADREVNDVLSASAGLWSTGRRRPRKVRLCAVSTVFSKRYPLRDVNR